MNTTTKSLGERVGHTPGPWSHTPMQDTIWANDGNTKIATIADLPWVTSASGRRHSDDATEQANARLIASSPELLEALRTLADETDRLIAKQYEGLDPLDLMPREGDKVYPDTRLARYVIAKATGQPS